MAKWVLLRLNDDSVANFVEKAGTKRVVGVWDIPTEFCQCTGDKWLKGNWHRDPEQQRPVCNDCKKVHQVYVSGLPSRTRWTFGRNIIQRFLPHAQGDEALQRDL